MMDKFTISCKTCGNNHAIATIPKFDKSEKHIEKGKPILVCPCGEVEIITERIP